MVSDSKRLFFALQVLAPWPEILPNGRILDESVRHMTLAFLGNIPFAPLEKKLSDLPKPPFSLGLVGQFDHFLFLPPKVPRVIAWNVHFLDKKEQLLLDYQKELRRWLNEAGYLFEERSFLPHVTLARAPLDMLAWERSFTPMPCFFSHLHLYESKGNLHYEPIWSYPFIAPFEEIEHTADIAYLIQGCSLDELKIHAEIALAFRFPPLLSFFKENEPAESIEEIVMQLNELISRADGEIGCPFKAVSFHGNIKKEATHLSWEMIVDV